jgi:hypothetical protein
VREVTVKTVHALLCSGVLFLGGTGPVAAAAKSPGSVTVSYVLHRIPKIASNQVAVWIEDERGGYVKTLFATNFTARGGFGRRPQCLPEWVKVSDWKNASPGDVDAVSGATQKAGGIELSWDCTDGNGEPVAPGTYVYKIEGNILWETRVVWQGRIKVGGARNGSAARAEYFPADAAGTDVLLEDVRAFYEPAM